MKRKIIRLVLIFIIIVLAVFMLTFIIYYRANLTDEPMSSFQRHRILTLINKLPATMEKEHTKKLEITAMKIEDNLIFNNERIVVEKNEHVGFIDYSGNIVIPCKYDAATSMNDFGYAIVREGYYTEGEYFVVDKEGKESLKNKFDFLQAYGKNCNFMYAVKDKKAGVVDYQGNVIIPLNFPVEVVRARDFDVYDMDDYTYAYMFGDKTPLGYECIITPFEYGFIISDVIYQGEAGYCESQEIGRIDFQGKITENTVKEKDVEETGDFVRFEDKVEYVLEENEEYFASFEKVFRKDSKTPVTETTSDITPIFSETDNIFLYWEYLDFPYFYVSVP